MRNTSIALRITIITILCAFGTGLINASQSAISLEHRTSAVLSLLLGMFLFVIAFYLLLRLLWAVLRARRAERKSSSPEVTSAGLRVAHASVVTSDKAVSEEVELEETKARLISEPIKTISTEQKSPQKLSPRKGRGASAIPFPSGPLWAEYTQDMFEGIIWRWHYKLQFDDEPRNVTPYCPECDRTLSFCNESQWSSGKWMMQFSCGYHHATQYYYAPGQSNFKTIKEFIRAKIEDGTFEAVISRQRMARR